MQNIVSWKKANIEINKYHWHKIYNVIYVNDDYTKK